MTTTAPLLAGVQGTPHCSIGLVCNAMHSLPEPSHHDLTTILAVFAGLVRKSGALNESPRTLAMEYLDDAMDAIDQDGVVQQTEQAWREQESRRLAA